MTNETFFVMQPIHTMRGLTVLCPVLSYSGRKRTSCNKSYGFKTSHAISSMEEKGGDRTKYFFTSCILYIPSLPLDLLARVSNFLSLLEAYVKKTRFSGFSLEILIR